MPKYEVTRSYTVSCVATVEADSHEHAEEIALYDGDYEAEITVEEIDNAVA